MRLIVEEIYFYSILNLAKSLFKFQTQAKKNKFQFFFGNLMTEAILINMGIGIGLTISKISKLLCPFKPDGIENVTDF